jgi:hypothetical protein
MYLTLIKTVGWKPGIVMHRELIVWLAQFLRWGVVSREKEKKWPVLSDAQIMP